MSPKDKHLIQTKKDFFFGSFLTWMKSFHNSEPQAGPRLQHVARSQWESRPVWICFYQCSSQRKQSSYCITTEPRPEHICRQCRDRRRRNCIYSNTFTLLLKCDDPEWPLKPRMKSRLGTRPRTSCWIWSTSFYQSDHLCFHLIMIIIMMCIYCTGSVYNPSDWLFTRAQNRSQYGSWL